MANLRFDITHANGTSESVETDAERVLIGRGAHCEVGLSSSELATEHVAIEVVGDTVRLVALAFIPQPTLDGQAVAEAVIPERALLRIGTLQIVITRLITHAATASTPKARSRASIVRLVGGVAMLVLLALIAVQAAGPSKAAPSSVPALWDESVASCPADTPAQARALAAEKRIVADGKRERHPFYVAEGVESVVLYELSAACFRRAGEGSLVDELTATASQLRAAVSDDYRIRRLRLERALAAQDEEVVAREVAMLHSLIGQKHGPYVEWINGLARKFELKKEQP